MSNDNSNVPFDPFAALAEVDATPLSKDPLAGPNLRFVADGSVQTFMVGDRQCGISVPVGGISLTHVTLSDQNGTPVLRGQGGLRGEIIGIMDGDTLVPLACYRRDLPNDPWGGWRNWSHLFNWEFQNADPAAIEALCQLALDAQWPEFEARPLQPGQEPYVRAEGVEIKFDREASGRNPNERFTNGVMLTSAVLVPDERYEANLTSYVNKDKVTVIRPAFTSLIDTMAVSLPEATLEALAGDRDNTRSAWRRLATLTGYNDDPKSGYPHRPTLGYVTPVNGDEINVFGINRGKAPAATAAAASAPTDTTGATSEVPFGTPPVE